MNPVLSISKVHNTFLGQNTDLSVESMFPVEGILNVGDMNIGTTTSQYNTKWKRRARNLPQQS